MPALLRVEFVGVSAAISAMPSPPRENGQNFIAVFL